MNAKHGFAWTRALRLSAALAASSLLFMAGCPGMFGEGELEVSCSGATVAEGAIVAFGDTVVGQSSTLEISVENSGSASLYLNDLTLGLPNVFSSDFSGTSLAAGAEDDFIITYSPSQAGSLTCAVSIGMDGDSFSFWVTGTAIAAIDRDLAPPAWIQGAWWQDGGTASDHNEYSLSVDNVVNTFVNAGVPSTLLDAAASNQTYVDSGMYAYAYSDSEPSSTTYVLTSSGDGSTIGTWTFEYQTASTMTLSIWAQGSGTSGPYTFQKQ